MKPSSPHKALAENKRGSKISLKPRSDKSVIDSLVDIVRGRK